MSEAEFWATVRRALRQYNEAHGNDQRVRAHQTIVRAVEKFCPETSKQTNTTEPFGSRAVTS
jgi:transposase-like protein